MPSIDTVSRIRNLLRRELRLADDEEIDESTPLSGGDLDLDSLDMLLIITAVEKEFGIKVREADAAGDGSGVGAGSGGATGAFRDVASLAAFVEGRAGQASEAGRAEE